MTFRGYLILFGMLLVCVLCLSGGYYLGLSSPANRPTVSSLSSEELERVERLLELKVIGNAGPYYVLANDARDSYAVGRGKEPMLLEWDEGEETKLIYNGRGGGISWHLSYKRGTSTLLHAAYSAQVKGGKLGAVDRYYHDVDGDGVFDRLMDLEGGQTYELRSLEKTDTAKRGRPE